MAGCKGKNARSSTPSVSESKTSLPLPDSRAPYPATVYFRSIHELAPGLQTAEIGIDAYLTACTLQFTGRVSQGVLVWRFRDSFSP